MKPSNTFNVIITKTPNKTYVGQCLEVPEAITQGDTEDELLENMKDAVRIALEVKRENTRKSCTCKNTYLRKLDFDS